MGFEIKWILLAEAVAQNIDGALSAIGIGQNVVIAQSVPTRTKRALIVHVASEEADLPGDQMVVEFSLVAPSGKTVVAQTVQAPILQPRFQGFPWAAHIPAEMVMSLTEFGTHIVHVVVAIDSEEHEATLVLHVLRAEEAMPMLMGVGAGSAESNSTRTDSNTGGIQKENLPSGHESNRTP